MSTKPSQALVCGPYTVDIRDEKRTVTTHTRLVGSSTQTEPPKLPSYRSAGRAPVYKPEMCNRPLVKVLSWVVSIVGSFLLRPTSGCPRQSSARTFPVFYYSPTTVDSLTSHGCYKEISRRFVKVIPPVQDLI